MVGGICQTQSHFCHRWRNKLFIKFDMLLTRDAFHSNIYSPDISLHRTVEDDSSSWFLIRKQQKSHSIYKENCINHQTNFTSGLYLFRVRFTNTWFSCRKWRCFCSTAWCQTNLPKYRKPRSVLYFTTSVFNCKTGDITKLGYILLYTEDNGKISNELILNYLYKHDKW